MIDNDKCSLYFGPQSLERIKCAQLIFNPEQMSWIECISIDSRNADFCEFQTPTYHDSHLHHILIMWISADVAFKINYCFIIVMITLLIGIFQKPFY